MKKYIWLLLIVLCSFIGYADNFASDGFATKDGTPSYNEKGILITDSTFYLHIDDIVATAGTTVKIPVYIQNNVVVSSFRMDMLHPEGFTTKNITKGERLTEGTSIPYNNNPNDAPNNTTRIIVLNLETNEIIEDTGYGKMFDINLRVPENAQGYYTLNFHTMKFADINTDLFEVPDMDVSITVGAVCTSISLSQTSATMMEGDVLQLNASVSPENASKTVAWASSDATVATVDETGLVRALVPGTATITATTTDGSNLSASCLVTVSEAHYDNYLSISDTTVFRGETIAIPIKMTNEENIVAFQTDIFLPEGFGILTDEDQEPVITPSGRLTSDHIIMADRLSDGSVRVICYTPRAKLIGGNEGDLFYITVMAPEEAGGDYGIYLRNSLLTASDYSEYRSPDAPAIIHVNTYIPGDVNDSRTVNVTDIVFTAQYILQHDPSPFIFEAADMNGDGNITVTDIMLIANLIMTPSMNAPKRMPSLNGCTDRISGDDLVLALGESRTVSLTLDNVLDYTAFQIDLAIPEGLTASNFVLTDRAGNHTFDVEDIGGKLRVLCYSPNIEPISGHSGALLTFVVTATTPVEDYIVVDGIEFVTCDCRTMKQEAFSIGVNSSSGINEVTPGKEVDHIDYFNVAGQRISHPDSGVTIIVTTYSDGTRTTAKIVR